MSEDHSSDRAWLSGWLMGQATRKALEQLEGYLTERPGYRPTALADVREELELRRRRNGDG